MLFLAFFCLFIMLRVIRDLLRAQRRKRDEAVNQHEDLVETSSEVTCGSTRCDLPTRSIDPDLPIKSSDPDLASSSNGSGLLNNSTGSELSNNLTPSEPPSSSLAMDQSALSPRETESSSSRLAPMTAGQVCIMKWPGFPRMPLAAPKPDYTAAIPLRPREFQNKTALVLTGYTRIFELAAQKNKANSWIYQLPREVVLEIMGHLDPVDMYIARQSCRLLFSLFTVAEFSHLQDPCRQTQQTSNALGLSSGQASTGIAQEDESSSLSPARYRPLFKFRLSKLDGSQKKLCTARIRQDWLCKSCLPNGPVTIERDPMQSGLYPRRFCKMCRVDHSSHYFSADQLHRRRDLTCIGWEGKKRICPHRSISLQDTFKAAAPRQGKQALLPPCGECTLLFRKDGKEEPPSLYVWQDSPDYCISSWTVQVCQLGKDQLVTKQLLRDGLGYLKRRFGDKLLCPHMSFDSAKLLEPFEWDRCICFRAAGEQDACSEHQTTNDIFRTDCCLCKGLEHRRAGRFMGGHCHKNWENWEHADKHSLSCPTCYADYTWVLDGRSVTLDYLQTFEMRDDIGASTDGPRSQIKVDYLWSWMRMLDPGTFQAGENLDWETLCDDRSCWNYHARMQAWYNFLWDT